MLLARPTSRLLVGAVKDKVRPSSRFTRCMASSLQQQQQQHRPVPSQLKFFKHPRRRDLHTRPLSSTVGQDGDVSEEGQGEEPPDPLGSLTGDMEAELVGKTTTKKLRLRNIRIELEFLRSRAFPLPETLTHEQWKRLLDFSERDHRTLYLDAILQGTEEDVFPELERLDEMAKDGLTFSEETFAGMYDPKDFETDGEQSLQDRIGMINYVYDQMRQAGEMVPVTIKKKHLKELISLRSIKAAEKFFAYLGQGRSKEVLDLVKKRARQGRAAVTRAKVVKERAEEEHLVYALGHNTIRIRLLDSTIEKQEAWNVIREFHSWGQPMVIDLSFMQTMSFKQAKSVAFRELPYAIRNNKRSRAPFALHFTNYDESCPKTRAFLQMMPNLMEDDQPFHCTPKCHTELFDRNRLVYLTPDSRTDLLEFNEDDVYILGALNDGGAGRPTTLAQAKRDGIRHARLPMKRFVGMSAELNVDHAASVLADFRLTRDWFFSFRWIPARFFRNRLYATSYSSSLESVYRAHSALSPQTHLELTDMTPREYRRRYAEIVAEHNVTLDGGVQRNEETGTAREWRGAKKITLSDLLS